MPSSRTRLFLAEVLLQRDRMIGALNDDKLSPQSPRRTVLLHDELRPPQGKGPVDQLYQEALGEASRVGLLPTFSPLLHEAREAHREFLDSAAFGELPFHWGERHCRALVALEAHLPALEDQLTSQGPRGGRTGAKTRGKRSKRRGQRGRPSVGDKNAERRFHDDWKASGRQLKDFARSRNIPLKEAEGITARERNRRNRARLQRTK